MPEILLANDDGTYIVLDNAAICRYCGRVMMLAVNRDGKTRCACCDEKEKSKCE